MKLKYRIKEALNFLAFAFYPKTTLVACAAFFALVIAILEIVMMATPQESDWYNIVFALTTGAAGSFFVSIIVELAGNYRHNKRAWHELQEYYSAVLDYELYKQVIMQQTPLQMAKSKASEEFVTTGGVEEIDEYDEPKDIIQITWKKLPSIIPVFRRTLNDKMDFLSDEEINELEMILSDAFLLSQFMENYDISQNGLDSYQDEIDRSEEEKEKKTENIALDFFEEVDEETFRAQNEEFNKQMESELRPFASWQLSKCCQNIAESVNVLEKSILRKSFYGMMLQRYHHSARKPIDDFL